MSVRFCSSRHDRPRARKRAATALLSLFLVLPLAACGGGGGGAGPFGAGQGLVLMSFEQDSLANAQLNTVLRFEFSEAVNANTVSSSAIQIREGPSFGATVPGQFRVNGATVLFEPQLPGNCDLSDGGLHAGTTYRVSIVGFPEEFSLRNTKGQPLAATDTFTFTTLGEQATQLFADGIPAAQPTVLSTAPASGAQAVKVEDGNRVVLTLSENVNPCSVTEASVRFHIYQLGDRATRVAADGGAGNASGFATAAGATADQAPGDPFSWGSAGQLPQVITLPTPQRVPAEIRLEQSFASTQLVITPAFGSSPDPLMNRSRFPENALLVVELTFGISDFGGSPLVPFTMAFTTENLTAQSSSYEMENEGETPYLLDESTAEVNTSRSPSRVQGYMLFAGDGDNGSDQLLPTLPGSNASACALPLQANSGAKDDFDPQQDVLLDTGGTPNTCSNDTDGSEAVIWEFRSLRIRSGVTVRVVGVNPAIILVQGDVNIESGGSLLVRGDGIGGSPRGRGANGYDNGRADQVTAAKGGIAVAGGGNGGDGTRPHATPYGHDGDSAYGSTDGQGVEGGEGAGLGGVSTRHPSTSNPWPSGSSQGGGGGGHAEIGETATALTANGVTLLGTPRGTGGGVYPSGGDAARMRTAQGGGGGGAAGYGDEGSGSTTFTNGGGSGGAGGGFLDLTSSGNIQIFGTIDAAGSRGGNGGNDTFYGGGGGGGGAGGGVRVLTPNEIILSGGTITAAGGAGGTATLGTGGALTGALNHGGAGGAGRIVLEDADSVIAGQGSASITPSEGSPGFFRGVFDATRFQGGGLKPFALTGVFPVGPLDPVFVDPLQGDFVVGVPVGGAPGVNSTALLIEVRGYEIRPDGSFDPTSETDWFSVGHFRDTGVETQPAWAVGHPLDIAIPADNALDAASPKGHSGSGFGALNAAAASGGFEFLQVRISVYLPNTIGPFDPGSYLDHWSVRFNHDQ